MHRLKRKKYKIIGFDDDRILCIGHIMLLIHLGLKIIDVMIYVLDKKVPYDMLLGRPWIHPMRCVPSTLHGLLKFNHEGKEYVIESAK